MIEFTEEECRTITLTLLKARDALVETKEYMLELPLIKNDEELLNQIVSEIDMDVETITTFVTKIPDSLKYTEEYLAIYEEQERFKEYMGAVNDR